MTLIAVNSQHHFINTPTADAVTKNASQALSSDKKLNEIQNLCRENGVGIVPEHLLKLQTLSQEKNYIIGIRPVDAMATDLIENGHPTKGFHIKGKSANWGPQTAFICVKQEFSKLADNPEKLGKFNQQVTSCLKEGHAQKIPLEITKARLDILVENGIVEITKFNDQRLPTELQASTPKGVKHTFGVTHAEEKPGTFAITHQGTPLEVLSPPGDNAKAMTADYDLFMVAPPIEEFGEQDMLPVHDIAQSVFKKRIDAYQAVQPEQRNEARPKNLAEPLREAYTSPAAFYQREDTEIGNASPRIRAMITEINQRLVGEGEPVVHHNTDTGSPATDMAANFPATFTLPKALGKFNDVCVIHDVNELKALVQEAKNSGYYVPLNTLWDSDITDIRSSRFQDAQNFLKNNWTPK
ncbi:adenylate cyclase [Enterobacterales bacterium CwR94]|nr:adenylate cyclase [Enterobacterales bacterium CwR94]